MAEFRRDPVSDRWVIIAENRSQRPDEFRARGARRVEVACPFCAGHERETPDPTAVYPPPGAGRAVADWQVRVVPNKFPAVHMPPLEMAGASGPSECSPARGAHEVIIETPQHVVSFTELTDAQAELTFAAYRDRLRHWRSHGHLAYGMIFKNARAEGGASIEHTHSQLLATASVPCELAREVAGAQSFRQSQGKCIFCDMLARERAWRQRWVAETDLFSVFCPYASRFPYEMWVLPRQHCSRFEDLEATACVQLAHLVRDLLRRLEWLLEEPAYNYWIHTAPWDGPRHDAYHWHLEIVTRLTRVAGFELGAGYFINPVCPEEAASRLRSIPPARAL